MIQVAVLTWPAAGDPSTRLAGLPVLLRQLLSLQDAGIERVYLSGGPSDLKVVDPRLRLTVTPGEPPAGQSCLRARAGLVWQPSVPRRLTRGDQTTDLESAPLEAGEFVVPTATEAERREAERRLYRSLIKPTDGFIARNFDRHISIAVSRLLVNTSVTPNQMTIAATLIGLVAVGVVLAGGAGALVPGAVLLMTQSILDGCDGELSRLKYLRSRTGEWLDQVGDDVVNLGYFAAVGVALRDSGSVIAGPVTAVGVVLHVVYQAALYAALATRGGGSGSVTSIRWWGQKPDSAGETKGWLHQLIEDAGRRDFFVFLYLPAALLGVSWLALVWSGVVFAVSGLTTGAQWIVGGGPEPARPPSTGSRQ